MMTSTKQCTRCKRTKSTEQFGPHSKAKDKLQSWCKPCQSDYWRERKSKKQAQILVPKILHSLLHFCAEAEGLSVDSYCARVLRDHAKERVLDDVLAL